MIGDGIIDVGGFINFDGAVAQEFAANDMFVELTFQFELGEATIAVVVTHVPGARWFLL